MFKRRRWSELTLVQKALIIVAGIFQWGLLGLALWDLRRRPAEEIRGSKRIWMGVVFINYVGPIAYFVLGRRSG